MSFKLKQFDSQDTEQSNLSSSQNTRHNNYGPKNSYFNHNSESSQLRSPQSQLKQVGLAIARSISPKPRYRPIKPLIENESSTKSIPQLDERVHNKEQIITNSKNAPYKQGFQKKQLHDKLSTDRLDKLEYVEPVPLCPEVKNEYCKE